MNASLHAGVGTPMWLRVLAASLATVRPDADEHSTIAAGVGLACEPLPFPAAWYGAADFRTKAVRTIAGAGLLHGVAQQAWAPSNFGASAAGLAMMTGKTQITTCDPDDRVLRSMYITPAEHGLRCSVTVPVRVGQEMAGFITAYSTASRPTALECTLLEQIATDLGATVSAQRSRSTANGALAGYLPSVADAQHAPVLVLSAVRDEARRVVDFMCTEANAVAAAMLHTPREELLQARTLCFPRAYSTAPLQAEILAALQAERSTVLRDFTLRSTLSESDERFDIPLLHGRDSVVMTWHAVSERFEAQAHAKTLSRQDHLTNLGSRQVFVEHLQVAFTSQRRRNTGVAVCVFGIDGLTRINEAVGLAGGDEVIKATAQRLVDAVGDVEHVGRLSGDAFAVLLPEERGPESAFSFAEHAQQLVQQPLSVLGQQVTPSLSVGIAYTLELADPEQLLDFAGLAMRRAKGRGRGRIEFADQQIAVDARERLAIEHAIRQGIAGGEFRSWYQPIVDLASGTVRGYESLARWENPRWEHFGPGRFIPMAESSGMVHQLDLAMMEQALRFQQTLPRDHFVSINVSVPSLAEDDYLVAACTLLGSAGSAANRVHLEITETALVGDTDRTIAAMQRMASYGARWFLDDFGTGYSSLSHLRDLPVSGLKLDMSFSRAIDAGDANALRLTQGLIGLAGGLGMETIAEGIEHDETAKLLSAQGWQLGQGYLFGKPRRITKAD